MNNVTINNQQRLFVIESEGGVSCLGFDVVDEQRRYIAAELKIELHDAAIGTLEAYEQHQSLVRLWCEKAKEDKSMIFFGSLSVPLALQKVLRKLVKTTELVRIMLGDPATGTVWMEEHDVVGSIGLSMGPMRVPLLVPEGERYGMTLLCDNVLMVKNWETSEVLFSRPFTLPSLRVIAAHTADGARFDVIDDKGTLAGFDAACKAYAYMAFMAGACVNPVEFQ